MKTKAQYIREWIACPQFGDDHYGDLGALPYYKRKIIKDFLDYVEALEIHDMDMSKRNLKAIEYINWSLEANKELTDMGIGLCVNNVEELIKILEEVNNETK